MAEKKTKKKRVFKGMKAVAKKRSQKKPLKKPKKTEIKRPKRKKITRVKTEIKAKPLAKRKREAKDPEDEKRAALRRLLIQKREDIVKEAKAEISKYTKGETRQLVDTALDNGDWSIVDLSADISLRQLSTHREILLKIDEALRKLAEDTYGKCEECGEDINEGRLKVLPFATHCRDCQEKKEQLEELEKEKGIE